jgi:HEAT repeat protein
MRRGQGDGRLGSHQMKRRLALYLTLLLIAASAMFWRVTSRSSGELQHAGRPLSAWLDEVGEGPEEQRARAIEALLAMDPEIWERLVNMVGAQDSVFHRGLARLGGAHLLHRLGARSADEQHGAAMIAFTALGPLARPAIPGLIGLLAKPLARSRSADALLAIGPDAVPALVGALTNANPEVRAHAAQTLGHFHGNATTALPALRNLAHDSSTNVSEAAALAVKMIETLDR